MVRELVAAGYKGHELLAEVMRLTGLPAPQARILVGIETGKGPFGDTVPPVGEGPDLWELLDRLTA